MSKLLEKLAELEHTQWIDWALNLMSQEELSVKRQQRWKKYMVPYEELSEEIKEQDREWAKKTIQILLDHGVFIGKRVIE